jgi:glycosyltransferase involved in cell wall biosynthesis
MTQNHITCIEVITVCKKPGKSIDDTLLSLLPHLKARLIRWHIVDAGISDTYLDRVRRFCVLEQLDVRVSYGHNSGIYPAMNYGIQKSESTHIIFINSGDLLNAKDLLSLYRKLPNDHRIVYIFNHHIKDISFPHLVLKRMQYTLFKYSSIALPSSHNSIIYPSMALKAHPFDEGLNCAADFEQYLALKNDASIVFKHINIMLTVVTRSGFIAQNKANSFKQHISILCRYDRPLACLYWRLRLAINY